MNSDSSVKDRVSAVSLAMASDTCGSSARGLSRAMDLWIEDVMVAVSVGVRVRIMMRLAASVNAGFSVMLRA